jgi:hypothetical protein
MIKIKRKKKNYRYIENGYLKDSQVKDKNYILSFSFLNLYIV